MIVPSLTNETDKALIESLKSLRSSENQAISDVVLYLAEVDKRQIYREVGYSSLYAFCVQHLKYSEGSAHRRIQAARALRANPEIYYMLREGKVSLCAISEISKVIKPDNKELLLTTIQGKPKLEVQKIAAQYQEPSKARIRETVKAKVVLAPAPMPLLEQAKTNTPTENRYTVTLEVDDEFMALVEEAKRKVGPLKMSQILKRSLKKFVETKAVTGKATVKVRAGTRYIPRATKAEVFKRDNHQCTYESNEGVRCCEKHGLEIDHIVPVAHGGGKEVTNLRLTCRAHNQLFAEQIMGREFIRSQIHRHRGQCH